MAKKKTDAEAQETAPDAETVADTAAIDTALEAPAEPAKRKRGRPRGSSSKTKADNPQAQLLRDQARVFGEAAAVPFVIIARRQGAHWKLEADEKLALGSALTECLIAYMPDVAKHAPLIYLGTVLTGIVAKRLGNPLQSDLFGDN
jgi:hypothetical protein